MLDSIVGLSLTVDEAGLDDFERAADVDEEDLLGRLVDRAGITEALVLRTCERFEIFYRVDRDDGAVGEVGVVGEVGEVGPRQVVGDAVPILGERGTIHPGTDAVEHLLRVACGLESTVLGEDQILGQLRDARYAALEAGALDGPLEEVALRAVRAGERARSETAIGEGAVSLGSIVADHARAELQGETLANTTVLVVGAGEMGTLVARAFARLDEPPASIRIANRTAAAAEHLAETVGGSTVPLAEVSACLANVDVVVTATGASEPILTPAELDESEVIVVDLGTPRDVAAEAGELDGIELTTVADLTMTRDRELELREAAVPAVESIVDEERDRLTERLAARRVDAVLRDVYTRCHEIRRAEVKYALERLHETGGGLTDEQEAVVEDLSEALVNGLLHRPATALREAAVDGDRTTVATGVALLPGGARHGNMQRRFVQDGLERTGQDSRERTAQEAEGIYTDGSGLGDDAPVNDDGIGGDVGCGRDERDDRDDGSLGDKTTVTTRGAGALNDD